MGSKTILLLSFFLTFTLLVVSEMAVNEKTDGAHGLDDAKYGGGGYGPGNGGYGPGNGGHGPGNSGYGPGNGGYGPGNGGHGPGNGGYGPGNGRYCRYGCCRRENYGGGCRVCCRYAGEVAVTAQPEDKPNN